MKGIREATSSCSSDDLLMTAYLPTSEARHSHLSPMAHHTLQHPQLNADVYAPSGVNSSCLHEDQPLLSYVGVKVT